MNAIILGDGGFGRAIAAALIARGGPDPRVLGRPSGERHASAREDDRALHRDLDRPPVAQADHGGAGRLLLPGQQDGIRQVGHVVAVGVGEQRRDAVLLEPATTR